MVYDRPAQGGALGEAAEEVMREGERERERREEYFYIKAQM